MTRSAIALLLAGLLWPPSALHADLSVTYKVTSTELVIFNQVQPSPFGGVSFRLFVQGPRVRTEMVDHTGRVQWMILDRATGRGYEVDPQTRTYARLSDPWGCRDLPTHLARSAAYLLSLTGADSVRVTPVGSRSVAGYSSREIAVEFQGRVLGAPQPVRARLTLNVPDNERAVFGASQLSEVYCGEKPPADQWAAAFQRHASLDRGAAGRLGSHVALPLEAALVADLGMGRAGVTLRAVDITRTELPDNLFVPPADFQERSE